MAEERTLGDRVISFLLAFLAGASTCKLVEASCHYPQTIHSEHCLAVRNGAACWKVDDNGKASIDWLCDGQPDKE